MVEEHVCGEAQFPHEFPQGSVLQLFAPQVLVLQPHVPGMPAVDEEHVCGEVQDPHTCPQGSELQLSVPQVLGQEQVPGTPGVVEEQDCPDGQVPHEFPQGSELQVLAPQVPGQVQLPPLYPEPVPHPPAESQGTPVGHIANTPLFSQQYSPPGTIVPLQHSDEPPQVEAPQVTPAQLGVQTHVPGPLGEEQVNPEAQVPQECPQASLPQLLAPQVLGQEQVEVAVMLVPSESLKQQFRLKTGFTLLISEEVIKSHPTS